MRIARWSLAASVLAAAGAALLFAGPSGVALADVVKAAAKHKLVRYKETTTIKFDPPPGVTVDMEEVSFDGVSYADLAAPRFRSETPEAVRLDGLITSSGYLVSDHPKNRALCVFAHEPTDKANDPNLPDHLKQVLKDLAGKRKGAVLTAVPDEPGVVNKKQTLLEFLRELETHKDAKAEKAGATLVYTVTAFPAPTRSKVTTLWVDAATKLPTRLKVEEEKPMAMTAWHRVEWAEFAWDPDIKPHKSLNELFSLAPPAGYEFEDMTKPPAAKGSPEEGGAERLAIESTEQRVARAKVIVVATALDATPAPAKVPGDALEHFIRFKVSRVLKGELTEKTITTRTPMAPAEFLNREWVVMLSPEFLAGTHAFAGCYGVGVEAEVKALVAKLAK